MKFLRHISFFAMLLSFLLLASPLLATCQEEFEIVKEPFMVSDATNQLSEMRSVVAVDHNGNAHLIWIDDEGDYLFYAMFDKNGKSLIAPTILLDGGVDYKYRKPKLAVDGKNCLHIVYHSEENEVSYLKVNPYLDDLDGSKADPNKIIVVGPTVISEEDDIQSVSPAIAVGDAVHIVWRDGKYDEQGAIWYTKLDENGNILISPIKLTDHVKFPDYANEPSITVDSRGNVHIVWNDYWDTVATEIAYMLVDGKDGDILIDKTLLTPNDGKNSRRPMVVADSKNCAHIVWHDRKSEKGATEIYYAKVNPYLDDLSGDAANPDVIVVIGPIMLSEDDGYRSAQPALAIDQYDRISVIWMETKWLKGTAEENEDLEVSYMMLSLNGEILVEEMRITWDAYEVDKYRGWFVPWVAAGGKVRVFITYTATYVDYYEVWLTILELPPPPPPPPPVGGYIIAPASAYEEALPTAWISLIALATTATTMLLYTKYNNRRK